MLDTLLRILALTRKELLAVLKDRRARVSLFVPPIIQGLIFGYAATYDLNHVPYAVLDQDRTAASRELLAGLDGSGVFVRVGNLHSAQDIRTYIDQRRALLVVQIEQNFERKLQLGQTADVQVIADGRNSNTAGTASSYITAVVSNFNDRWRTDHGLPPAVLTSTDRAWYNPNLDTRWNMIPGLIGQLAMFQTLLLTAMSVAREREQGTFDQLLVTPFRSFEIMAAANPTERTEEAAAVPPEPEALLPKFLSWAADKDMSVPMENAQPLKVPPAKEAQAKASSKDREREQEARADRRWEERHARRLAAARKNVRRAP